MYGSVEEMKEVFEAARRVLIDLNGMEEKWAEYYVSNIYGKMLKYSGKKSSVVDFQKKLADAELEVYGNAERMAALNLYVSFSSRYIYLLGILKYEGSCGKIFFEGEKLVFKRNSN